MRVTINNINKAIEKHGYEIVKGEGYFYFAPLDDNRPLADSSVYTYHLTSYTVEEWEETLLDKIDETNIPGFARSSIMDH